MSAETANEVSRMWEHITNEEFIDPYELAYVKLKSQLFKFIESLDVISDRKMKKMIDKCHKIDIGLKVKLLKNRLKKP